MSVLLSQLVAACFAAAVTAAAGFLAAWMHFKRENKHRKTVVLKALHAELGAINTYLDQPLIRFDPDDTQFASDVERDVMKSYVSSILAPGLDTRVFDGNVQTLGLLDNTTATDVIDIYQALKRLDHQADLVSHGRPLGRPIPKGASPAAVLYGDVEALKARIAKTRARIDEALQG